VYSISEKVLIGTNLQFQGNLYLDGYKFIGNSGRRLFEAESQVLNEYFLEAQSVVWPSLKVVLNPIYNVNRSGSMGS